MYNIMANSVDMTLSAFYKEYTKEIVKEGLLFHKNPLDKRKKNKQQNKPKQNNITKENDTFKKL